TAAVIRRAQMRAAFDERLRQRTPEHCDDKPGERALNLIQIKDVNLKCKADRLKQTALGHSRT
ncbi:MAG: hypothetical protein WAV38_14680, partial [Xanthobacteraceae bacterium]